MTVLGIITTCQWIAFAGVVCFLVAYSTWSAWTLTATGRTMMALATTVVLLLSVGLSRSLFGAYPGIDYVRLGAYVILAVVWPTIFILLLRAQGRR